MKDIHTNAMLQALRKAEEGAAAGEVPVGAVVYRDDGTIIAAAHNETIMRNDPTAHAEFLAARAALTAVGDMYLEDCYVAVTLEPCAMCAQALSWMRIKGIYFGAYDPKSGGTENGAQVLKYAHHKPQVIGGQMEDECVGVLQKFFLERRT